MTVKSARQPLLQSDLLRYILDNEYRPGDRLPTIQEISRALNVSVAKVRESLEIARVLGIVEVRPRRGTQIKAYNFEPAMTLSALYAISQDGTRFAQLGKMRNALEISFWEEAVSSLTTEDIAALHTLLDTADRKLQRDPIEVPADEHRAFHLMIFSHLDNLFVRGVLESFWEAYDAFGLNRYQALDYYRQVWDFHRRIVDAIEAGELEKSRQLLIDHMNLLDRREGSGEG